ncbi:MAG: GNAT family N-acetyltransferase [Rhodobacteraceae bacterium]|nr:GNAT family N-acetyltransferase [Paracoccaceae bacterium]
MPSGEEGALDGVMEYTVTFLEMTAPPATSAPPPLSEGGLALMRAEKPPVHYFLYLYRTVGADYQWEDMLKWSEEELTAFVQHEKVELFTLHHRGAPAGFFQLDFREDGVCDLAYFGLMPQAVGRGWGRWLLSQAIQEAWAPSRAPGIQAMTVNTCTLDHPSALRMYQRGGFEPARRETRQRVRHPF